MRTDYRIDDYQQTYFVIDSFEDLLRQTLEADFSPIYAELTDATDLSTDTVLPDEVVFTHGTQDYAHSRLEMTI